MLKIFQNTLIFQIISSKTDKKSSYENIKNIEILKIL